MSYLEYKKMVYKKYPSLKYLEELFKTPTEYLKIVFIEIAFSGDFESEIAVESMKQCKKFILSNIEETLCF